MAENPIGEQEIANREHIAPQKTGDNIAAKKVALYVDDGTFSGVWVRMTQPSSSGGGNGAILDGVDSSIKATVKDLTNSNPVTVAIVDANGNQIASFGGGTQYNEDTVAGSGDTGTLSLTVRNDGQTTSTSADGDYSAGTVDAAGRTYIKDADFQTRIDAASSVVTYIGNAAPGTATSASSWQVKKIDSSSNPTTILFADGDPKYDNVFDNRASLSYS